MSDLFEPRSAFADLGLRPAPSPAQNPGLHVGDRDGVGLATALVRAGQETALRALMTERFGLELPNGPRRAVAGPLIAIGTAPGAWLLVDESGRPDFAPSLAQTLAGLASVADQSGAYAVLRVAGPALRDVLAKGVALDLHATAFPPDAAAVTMVGHIGLTLWRVDAAFDLAVPRSMFGSFWSWLVVSAASAGLAVDGVTIDVDQLGTHAKT